MIVYIRLHVSGQTKGKVNKPQISQYAHQWLFKSNAVAPAGNGGKEEGKEEKNTHTFRVREQAESLFPSQGLWVDINGQSGLYCVVKAAENPS